MRQPSVLPDVSAGVPFGSFAQVSRQAWVEKYWLFVPVHADAMALQ
jgi:hypothetical protein